MSLQQRWFHMLTAHQGIADASPVQRHNWARWLISAGVLGLALVLLFYRLGDGSLHDWDEAIYAQVAKELSLSHDWGTLTWNGYPFFHKPPLYFWLTAFTHGMIGINELAARFWPAIFGFGVVVLTFFLRVRFRSWTVGATAALLLLVVDYGYYGYWWNFLSLLRVGMLDALLTFWIMVALVLVWEAERRPWLIALLILVAKSHRSLPTRLRRKRGKKCLCHERWAAEPYGTRPPAAGPPSYAIRPPTPPACRRSGPDACDA
jgi:predicted membrane-bound mannosyltransferase